MPPLVRLSSGSSGSRARNFALSSAISSSSLASSSDWAASRRINSALRVSRLDASPIIRSREALTAAMSRRWRATSVRSSGLVPKPRSKACTRPFAMPLAPTPNSAAARMIIAMSTAKARVSFGGEASSSNAAM